jgi:hypothetical protein
MRYSDSKAKIFILGTAILLTLLAVSAQADPIQDGALAVYKAGWFANNGPSGPLTCSQTCKAKAPGTLAEYEASPVPNTKRAFLCRVDTGKPLGSLTNSLYGTQFDERAACYKTGIDLKGSFTKNYFCLCVAKG